MVTSFQIANSIIFTVTREEGRCGKGFIFAVTSIFEWPQYATLGNVLGNKRTFS